MLAKIFLGPMLKVWIGVVLVGGAYVGVKATLSWFESRVVEYEQAQLENASLRASNAFLEAQRKKERAVISELEKRLQTAHRSFDEYRESPPTEEVKEWRDERLPDDLIKSLRNLTEESSG